MKKILIIDGSDLFREFLTHKLKGYGFEIAQAINGFDGIMKMRQIHFDLIIMDYYLSRSSSIEVLEAKIKNPNIKEIPVIMASAKIDRNSLLKVSQFGVKKFFTKPVKMDMLVKALSEILHVKIEVDTTPCIIDAHYNEGIIFVEIAQGLNMDKIELLKYRLQELIELHKIDIPKILVMMTGLEIGANDSLQLGSLISALLDRVHAKASNIKLLANSEFVGNYLKKPLYAGIEMVDSLDTAMDGLLGTGSTVEFFSSMIVDTNQPSGFNLHFEGETVAAAAENLKELGANTNIAVIDDDFVIREIIKKAFSQTGIRIETFADGSNFLGQAKAEDFDLIFLDLLMPQVNGFEVLQKLADQGSETPVIVLSALSKRETVLKALKFGIKSYITKPVQPDAICRKAVEVLRMNF